MNRIFLRNVILSGIWLTVVVCLIATGNARYAVPLFPGLLTLWMHNGHPWLKAQVCPLPQMETQSGGVNEEDGEHNKVSTQPGKEEAHERKL